MKRREKTEFEKLFPLMSTVVSDDVAQHGNIKLVLSIQKTFLAIVDGGRLPFPFNSYASNMFQKTFL